MLAYSYQKYLKLLSAGYATHAERQVHKQNANPRKSSPAKGGAIEEKSQREWDNEATKLGNKYRGAGVMVGLLGTAIVFAAVTPSALELSKPISFAFNCAEVFLLLCVLYVVLMHSNKDGKDVRQDWIRARKYAEVLRYTNLKSCIFTPEATGGDGAKLAALKNEMTRILVSPEDGQIAYNQNKHAQCERIEHITERVTWLGFSLALGGAIAHIFTHPPALSYLTVFVPALVGALHGTNGFLQISRHSMHHHEMAHELNIIRNKLEKETDGIETVQLANELYGRLTNGDHIWGKSIEQQALHA